MLTLIEIVMVIVIVIVIVILLLIIIIIVIIMLMIIIIIIMIVQANDGGPEGGHDPDPQLLGRGRHAVDGRCVYIYIYI